MKQLLTEWRKFLKEGQEFVEEKSPLTYSRASNIQRLALRDDSIEPPYRGDFGFADQYTGRNPRTGRMTKKRFLEAPGAGDDIIGFLDYHDKGKTSEGNAYLYIDYMKTRREHKQQGVATKLLDECGASTRKPKRNIQIIRLWAQKTSHEKATNRVAEVLKRRFHRYRTMLPVCSTDGQSLL